MSSLLELAGLVLAGAALGNQAARRDALAARRFRSLPPATVSSAADQQLNRAWHRVGLQDRIGAVALVAGYGCVAHGFSLLAYGLAAVLLGAALALVFDLSLNLRLGLPWAYTGTTAATDAWLAGRGKLAAAVKLAVLLAGSAAWALLGL